MDLGRLILWTLRDYDEIDPVILCGETLSVVASYLRVHQFIYFKLVAGDEEAEVSIKDAAEAVKKAMDFDGEIVVSFHSATLKLGFNQRSLYPTAGTQAAPQMQNELKAPANETFMSFP